MELIEIAVEAEGTMQTTCPTHSPFGTSSESCIYPLFSCYSHHRRTSSSAGQRARARRGKLSDVSANVAYAHALMHRARDQSISATKRSVIDRTGSTYSHIQISKDRHVISIRCPSLGVSAVVRRGSIRRLRRTAARQCLPALALRRTSICAPELRRLSSRGAALTICSA